MNRKQFIRVFVHLCIWLVVCWGVYRSIEKSTEQLQAQRQTLNEQVQELESRAASSEADQANQVDATGQADKLRAQANQLRKQVDDFWKADWRWLALAGLAYALGMMPSCAYWIMCMNAMEQRVPVPAAIWAYFYGNLGKYVPGKAMVVIMRVTTLAPYGIRKVATTLAIFMETLTSMAVGGTVAAICVLFLDVDYRLRWLAVGLLAATIIPTAPVLLRLVLRKLQPGVDPLTLDQWTSRLNWKLTLKGWASLGFTWIGFGLSLGCVLYGLPSTQWLAETQTEFWLSVYAACALAIVIGFVSLMPGGAGVREVVLATILAPVVGPTAALCCAIWLRFTWIVAELVMAGTSYLVRRYWFR